MKTIIENKKALFNYQILEKFKAGVVLTGQEVKSVKNGRISLKGAFVVVKGEEVFLIGASIPPYQPKNAPKDYNPQRSRKLLLKKSEIKHLIGKAKQKGLTMIPLKVYTERGKIKIEFAVVRGKKKVDKREEIKKREIEREIKRALKSKI
ncbi:MAG: SsrA-binding protein [Candidatus Nealsonbacteria bacterium]|nr:MAG: SsrA-binding protein [Candidatus Nealsonbacteria bacterium]